MSNTALDWTFGMSNIEPHQVIEEAVDAWIFERRLTDRTDKQALWRELGEAVGVTDRQFKRYYTGDTPLPIDKVVPLCNHIKSSTLAIYLVESIAPPYIEDMDSLDFVEELIKNIDAFSIQARVAANALNSVPSADDFRQLQAAGRRLRSQLKIFEGLYYQTLVQHEEVQKRKAHERRTHKARRIRKALEKQGQTSLFNIEEPDDQAKDAQIKTRR